MNTSAAIIISPHLLDFSRDKLSICGVIENSDCYSCIMDIKNCKIIYAARTNDVQKNYGKLTMQNYRNVLIP